MLAAMRPEYGGRVELKLVTGSESLARYDVRMFDPRAEWTTQADVSGERALTLAGWTGPDQPPGWLETLAKTLLRGTVRQQQAAGSWPRRVTRWRPGPGGEE